jgi:methyl-accepting chemotaxis protein
MIFIFIIIMVLSVFSGYYLNKLSDKTSAILSENYLSVVYAREMSDGITKINQELLTSFLNDRNSDTLIIKKESASLTRSLLKEKNNLTEPDEDILVSEIETGYNEYRDSVLKYMKTPKTTSAMIYLQNKSANLFQQLLILSEINGKAIENKTNDAKVSSQRALTHMTLLASICFLIGVSFTFSFASYFNRRFFQLYYGIKKSVSSNFDQPLYLDGNDEFYEISLVFNEMSDKLKKYEKKMSVTLHNDIVKNIKSEDIEELKKMLLQIKNTEIQASALLLKLEKK